MCCSLQGAKGHEDWVVDVELQPDREAVADGGGGAGRKGGKAAQTVGALAEPNTRTVK